MSDVLEHDKLDGVDEDGQSHKSGIVAPEGELELSRSVARRMGWVPQEEWKRDPSKWVDAPDFLERTPAELAAAKDRLRRTGQAAEAALEEAKRQARSEAERELRQAAKDGDEEKAVEAARKVAENSGPPPQSVAWVNRNSWFNDDPAARAVAVEITKSKAREGLSVEDQLAAAEAEVRRRFPEYFPGQVQERREERLSERKPPVVAEGSRGAPPVKRDKGWGDIPTGVRSQVGKFIRSYMASGMTEDAARARYAGSYWRTQDGPS